MKRIGKEVKQHLIEIKKPVIIRTTRIQIKCVCFENQARFQGVHKIKTQQNVERQPQHVPNMSYLLYVFLWKDFIDKFLHILHMMYDKSL